jgi:hypothetical protein
MLGTARRKSDHELNTTVTEYFLILLMDIYTPTCGQRFESYGLLKLMAAEILFGTELSMRSNLTV